jgi:hypothetical protein
LRPSVPDQPLTMNAFQPLLCRRFDHFQQSLSSVLCRDRFHADTYQDAPGATSCKRCHPGRASPLGSQVCSSVLFGCRSFCSAAELMVLFVFCACCVVRAVSPPSVPLLLTRCSVFSIATVRSTHVGYRDRRSATCAHQANTTALPALVLSMRSRHSCVDSRFGSHAVLTTRILLASNLAPASQTASSARKARSPRLPVPPNARYTPSILINSEFY